MLNIYDFLTLNTLITPYLILGIYWAGAVGVPFVVLIAGWWLKSVFKNNFQFLTDTGDPDQGENALMSKPMQFLFLMFALGVFFFLELMWRVMWEFIIVYFNMHDVLKDLANAMPALAG